MIGWLVVDLGGVAAAFRPDARLAALAQACDLPTAEIHRRLFASGLDSSAELGHIAPEDIVTKIIGALDDRLTADQLIDAWATAFAPDSELLAWVGTLDVRRCLFTNNGPMINHCLEGPLREVASSFDQVICSWQIRSRKPDRAAFEYVQQTLDASPTSVLLVDDDHLNVHAAASLGWHTHLHGMGLGSFLLAHGEAMIAAGGHSDFDLHARVENLPAIAFDKALWWTVTDRLIHTVEHGISYHEHVIVKHRP